MSRKRPFLEAPHSALRTQRSTHYAPVQEAGSLFRIVMTTVWCLILVLLLVAAVAVFVTP